MWCDVCWVWVTNGVVLTGGGCVGVNSMVSAAIDRDRAIEIVIQIAAAHSERTHTQNWAISGPLSIHQPLCCATTSLLSCPNILGGWMAWYHSRANWTRKIIEAWHGSVPLYFLFTLYTISLCGYVASCPMSLCYKFLCWAIFGTWFLCQIAFGMLFVFVMKLRLRSLSPGSHQPQNRTELDCP